MSTNIHFTATRDIIVVTTQQRDIQQISFGGVYQTPTRVTNTILASDTPIEEYIEWVLTECSRDEMFPTFAHDDIFEETPIGEYTYNAGKEHVSDFRDWVKRCQRNGYTVQAEAW